MKGKRKSGLRDCGDNFVCFVIMHPGGTARADAPGASLQEKATIDSKEGKQI